jgi:hypothetical protein
VPETHARAELHQAGIDRGRRGVAVDPELRRGRPDQRGITDRLRRRQQQQFAGLVRHGVDAPPEVFFDGSWDSRGGGQSETARQLLVGQSPW